jgi:hypothetical protein
MRSDARSRFVMAACWSRARDGVGVLGVFAGDVASRRKEIGIRPALGSRDSGILLACAARAVVARLAGGVAIALVAGRGMQSLLFGIGVADPVSFSIVSVLVCALAIAAAVISRLSCGRWMPPESPSPGTAREQRRQGPKQFRTAALSVWASSSAGL